MIYGYCQCQEDKCVKSGELCHMQPKTLISFACLPVTWCLHPNVTGMPMNLIGKHTGATVRANMDHHDLGPAGQAHYWNCGPNPEHSSKRRGYSYKKTGKKQQQL
ncbi:hypothetical protein OWV82_014250 [Melia azedarach]|uniref:Uncharacterized protein n=1 Tax=Melia azedarach TaxID=155640 RepID=A0ACC1XKI7_MELAZ|nr:hypothetical protein OWV82_014250 [Melia azedarach]